MKVWLPVYQFEDKYEVNILDGIVRYKSNQGDDQDILLELVAIETISETGFEFHGYGATLIDSNNQEHLVDLDKIIVESILKRQINQPIYHKNGIKIDCSYNNLTLNPPQKNNIILRAEEAKQFYQYKLVRNDRHKKELFTLDKVYNSYEEFSKETGLTYSDFSRQKLKNGRIMIGMYLWSFNELKVEKSLN